MDCKKNKDIIFEIYKDSRTVFRIGDIAMLLNEIKTPLLCKKLNYYVQNGKIDNPRRGFYTKKNYKPEEFSCLLYPPTYISLEHVLQRAGVVFQYDKAITCISYLSREIEVENHIFRYRQMKGDILTNTAGILQNQNNINIATPERAFLDMLYLNKHFYFDNPNILNKKKISDLIPIYKSNHLQKTVHDFFSL